MFISLLCLAFRPVPLPTTRHAAAVTPNAAVAQNLRSTPPVMDSERPEAFVGSTFGSTSALFYRQGTLVLEDGTRLRGVSLIQLSFRHALRGSVAAERGALNERTTCSLVRGAV